ncbi:hypothetical protein SKAU_G00392150 [Synaphobranchus kaupii]|uniref:Uncharacterized protein n=1 Tax=Synaphobranchus kaupii TaxID=118154 RepID=A0A9Q1EBN1_SYNKA|nr:hypothetical protein SKAU_G00392150 [Synaphobranchus kaupii]
MQGLNQKCAREEERNGEREKESEREKRRERERRKKNRCFHPEPLNCSARLHLPLDAGLQSVFQPHAHSLRQRLSRRWGSLIFYHQFSQLPHPHGRP